jgi:hypothetical protein
MTLARRIPILLATGYALALCVPAPASAADPVKAVVWERYDSKHSDRADIWIANPDGSAARKLVRGEQPDISPDGRWVAYTVKTSTQYGLFVIPSGGGAVRVVFSDSGPSTPEYDYTFDWSTDSSKLAFGVSGDASLIATYDINTGQRGKSVGFVNPSDVGFVPGSYQIVVTIGGEEYDTVATRLLLMNSEDGSVRQLAELADTSADSVVLSPSSAALQADVDSSSSFGGPLSSARFPLKVVDMGTGGVRSLGVGIAPISWRADGHTLDGVASTCDKTTCTFEAVTIDSASGLSHPIIKLGAYSLKRIKQHRRHGKARRRLVIRFDVLTPTAVASDGSALLAQLFRYKGRGSFRLERTPIERVPTSGAPPQVIAHGANPDWNL